VHRTDFSDLKRARSLLADPADDVRLRMP